MLYGLPRNCNEITALLWTSRNKSYRLQEKCVVSIQEIRDPFLSVPRVVCIILCKMLHFICSSAVISHKNPLEINSLPQRHLYTVIPSAVIYPAVSNLQ